jgi:hypothetical protein
MILAPIAQAISSTQTCPLVERPPVWEFGGIITAGAREPLLCLPPSVNESCENHETAGTEGKPSTNSK